MSDERHPTLDRAHHHPPFRVYQDRGLWLTRCYSCGMVTAGLDHSDALGWIPSHVAYHDELVTAGG